MEQADLLVALGTRFVCQSDCSRTGYPKVERVININTDVDSAMHYNKTIALVGEVSATLRRLIYELKNRNIDKSNSKSSQSEWFKQCSLKKQEWETFKAQRYNTSCLYDQTWGQELLTQPAAIKVATDWARSNDIVTFFDAGDVQAHGFQIIVAL